jgi:hypothetical protein
MTARSVHDARLVNFWHHRRIGQLTVIEAEKPGGFPFPIARLFTITDVPAGASRGNHAHRICSQMLVCLAGRITVHLDDGNESLSVRLPGEDAGLLIPPLIWNRVQFETDGGVLLVVCDEAYDEADYLRSRAEFQWLAQAPASGGVIPEFLTPCPSRSVAQPARPFGEEVALAMTSVARPDVLARIHETSLRHLGWIDEYPPYLVIYPWVAAALAHLRAGDSIIALGAGITPMPLYFASLGLLVQTVDGSSLVRRLPSSRDWNGWGFLDYSTADPRIKSTNCRVREFAPDRRHDAAYSVGMIAHLPASERHELFANLRAWLKPGARFLFTVDIMRPTDFIWNRAEGKEVEPVSTHGTIDDVYAELTNLGFSVSQFRVLRNVRGSITDILFVDCATSEAPLSAEDRAR